MNVCLDVSDAVSAPACEPDARETAAVVACPYDDFVNLATQRHARKASGKASAAGHTCVDEQ